MATWISSKRAVSLELKWAEEWEEVVVESWLVGTKQWLGRSPGMWSVASSCLSLACSGWMTGEREERVARPGIRRGGEFGWLGGRAGVTLVSSVGALKLTKL